MPKDDRLLPQELKTDLKQEIAQPEPDLLPEGTKNGKNKNSVVDGPVVIGGGDPNLSPDAGRPVI